MIFQALIELYNRYDETEAIPPFGFSEEALRFFITIDLMGNLVEEPEDLWNAEYKSSIVPYSNKVNVRSSGAATTPNFMVDKGDYIFGMSGKTPKATHRESFINLIDEVCKDSQDEGVLAVKNFLKNWQPEKSVDLRHWDEICGPQGKWVAFRLEGEKPFIHERDSVKKLWSEHLKGLKYERGISFTDGKENDLQPQYAQFPFGSGASLVSFNNDCYESYGKKRGENAPISVVDEFKSSTALKYLINNNNKHRIKIGDSVTVFWAAKGTPMEALFPQIINPSMNDDIDPSMNNELASIKIKIEAFLEAARKGNLPNEIEADIQFYILGFSLNKARLALRFWHVDSVEELTRRLGDHFECMRIERSYEKDIEYPGVWHILKETARETKGISPLLAGELIRSILTGHKYPISLYQGVLRRIRVDGNVNYLRASTIKAVLQRNYNYVNEKEISMSLDVNRRESAYLLGRLFAVLEKAQLDALGKVNTTIKDRFFGAASATPSGVFPRLLKLAQHHIEKAEYGVVSDIRISEIMENLDSFPLNLNLQEQGLFAIGYYHQKNNFYIKKENKGENNE